MREQCRVRDVEDVTGDVGEPDVRRPNDRKGGLKSLLKHGSIVYDGEVGDYVFAVLGLSCRGTEMDGKVTGRGV